MFGEDGGVVGYAGAVVVELISLVGRGYRCAWATYYSSGVADDEDDEEVMMALVEQLIVSSRSRRAVW